MKAHEIQPGDQYVSYGQVQYTVLSVDVGPRDVLGTVRHLDGGSSQRTWFRDTEVPLTRPVPDLRIGRPEGPAWEARRQADAAGTAYRKAFDALLAKHGIDPFDVQVEELARLFDQLRADEYEAGWESGRAQHPANRKA